MAISNPFREYTLANPKGLTIEKLHKKYERLKSVHSDDPFSLEGFRSHHNFISLADGELAIRRELAKPRILVRAESNLVLLRYFFRTSIDASVLSSVIILPNGSVRVRPTSEEIQTARVQNARAEVGILLAQVLDVATYCEATIPQMIESSLLIPREADDLGGIFDFDIEDTFSLDQDIRFPNPEPDELVAITIFKRLLS